MTIEQLLGLDSKGWEAISTEELKQYAEQYLKITRPELAEKPEKFNRKQTSSNSNMSKKQQAQEILKNLGIKVDRW